MFSWGCRETNTLKYCGTVCVLCATVNFFLVYFLCSPSLFSVIFLYFSTYISDATYFLFLLSLKCFYEVIHISSEKLFIQSLCKEVLIFIWLHVLCFCFFDDLCRAPFLCFCFLINFAFLISLHFHINIRIILLYLQHSLYLQKIWYLVSIALN